MIHDLCLKLDALIFLTSFGYFDDILYFYLKGLYFRPAGRWSKISGFCSSQRHVGRYMYLPYSEGKSIAA